MQGARPPAHVEKEDTVADRDFAGIRACVFDAYGTLFDFASAAAACSDVLGDKTADLALAFGGPRRRASWRSRLKPA